MSAGLPLVLAHGGALGAVVLVLMLLVAAASGPTLAMALLRAQQKRRLARLGAAAGLEQVEPAASVVLAGRLLPARGAVPSHLDGADVAVSVASRGRAQQARRARRVAIESAGGAVVLRGPIRIEIGSTNVRTRDASIASTVLQTYRPRVWLPTTVRTLGEGDEVVVRGRAVAVRSCERGRAVVLDSPEIVYAGELRPEASWRKRAKYALATALVLLAASAAAGYFGVWLGTKAPTFGLRWAGVWVAAVTPFRSAALAAAEELFALELVAAFPEEMRGESQYFRTRSGHGLEQAGRYVALARVRKDCERAPEQLSRLSVVYADLTEPAVELSLACKRPLDLVSVADARFWESDFESASRVFESAAVVWGETDREQPMAGLLSGSRARKEIFTHWLAGRFEVAGRSIDRMPKERRASFACVRRALLAAADGSGARDDLRAHASECPLDVAAFEPSRRKELLAAHPKAAEGRYLYQGWALQLEPLLAPGVKLEEVHSKSSTARLEKPYELLSFPHGTRDLDPAIVAELLNRVERDRDPSPGRRLLRARLASTLVPFESLLAEHGRARQLVRLARSDLEELARMPVTDGGDGPSSYESGRLGIEARLVALLEAAVELRAGDVDRADRVLSEIPPLEPVDPEKSWLESERSDFEASLELLHAFAELWRGKAERLRRFAGSEHCTRMSGCFIVRGNLEALTKAASGDPENCDDTACLVAARTASAHAALGAHADRSAGLAAVTENPLDRVYRIGHVRSIAHAIGDQQRVERMTRWLAVVRPRALDPRLVIAQRTLDQLH